MSKTRKPKKPYPDFPLFAHATGQWAKKIRGKMHYFGTDPDIALRKYTAERDDLQAGRTPRATPANGVAIKDLCNRFLTAKKRLQDAGELSPLTWRGYHDTCEILIQFLGREMQVANITTDDFERLRDHLAKGRGPHGLGTQIRRLRTIFKFAFDADLIDKPLRLGPTFKVPNRKAMRKARETAGTRMIEPDELRRLMQVASVPMRAMILLGLNCGYGQSDVANLEYRHLDLEGGWAVFPRPKTGTARRCPLWPETIDAIQAAIAVRPDAKSTSDKNVVFVTRCGHRWVRIRTDDKGIPSPVDSVTVGFRKLLLALEMKRAGAFYNLRHVFRTVADAAKDSVAVDLIMGHVDPSMGAVYRERIEDSRLKAVVKHVHNWLWPEGLV